jgi:LysM repeat protein
MIGAVAVAATTSGDSAAFTHVVRPGESVSQIAERVYGRVELERVVAAANALGDASGTTIVPGMRLELPAVEHHKVLPGETWHSIAAERLGAPGRGDVLAQLNHSNPWLPPAIGSELVVPYALRYVASRGDTTEAVAYRFLGRRDEAYVVASYNDLKRAVLLQGEVILVPLSDLPLTEEGKREALGAAGKVRSEGAGEARAAQELCEREIPQLRQHLRHGRYLEAVVRGAGLLAHGGLSEPQLGQIERALTEAYAALDARGLAATACAEWRRHDPDAVLDPIELSPKILLACIEAGPAPGEPRPGATP